MHFGGQSRMENELLMIKKVRRKRERCLTSYKYCFLLETSHSVGLNVLLYVYKF